MKRAFYFVAAALATAPLSALAHAGHGYEATGTDTVLHYALSPLHYIAAFITISVVVAVSLAVVNRLVHRTITVHQEIDLEELHTN